MSHLDNISLAYKKNRVGKSRLETELNRINREQLIEMRMHNNSKQRFKNKYAKLDVFDENRGSEPSDVVMYETHNPGFCYRRNGDCRLPQSNITSSSLDMEDLHMLLFSNHEIDIDKVVCLYLLTAHKTEMLTPPPKSQRTSFLAREQSPLERLVDRSKKRAQTDPKQRKLPLYTVDVGFMGVKELVKDTRLVSKIIVNDKILQIVDSVTSALAVSNVETLSKFLTIVKSMELIKDTISKPHILNFIKNLHGQNIISSCESFHLEALQKDSIVDFDVGVLPLENLVSAIRKNVLQMPNSDSWKMYYKPIGTSHEVSVINASEQIEVDFVPEESSEPMMLLSFPKPSDEVQEFRLDYDENEAISNEFLNQEFTRIQPKILKNLQLGFSNVKYDEDDEEELSPSISKYEKMDFNKLANLLSQKVRKETMLDARRMLELEEYESSTCVHENIPSNLGSKYTLRQTTCEACIRKWKNPLPVPKTSKLKKVPLPVLKDTSYYSSRSAQRISEIIDDEVKKFETYAKSNKTEHVSLSNRIYKKLAKGNYVLNSSIEIVDLDDLELAKIRQEIKENETRKKFEDFLKIDIPKSKK